MTQTLDKLASRIPLTVWVAIVAAAASWGGTYALINNQIEANAAGIRDIQADRLVAATRADARLRSVEDDNRDQKADISRIDAAQKDVSATLRTFQDDTRNRLEYLLVTTQGVKTTVDNMAAASGVRLPNDPPIPTRTGR